MRLGNNLTLKEQQDETVIRMDNELQLTLLNEAVSIIGVCKKNIKNLENKASKYIQINEPKGEEDLRRSILELVASTKEKLEKVTRKLEALVQVMEEQIQDIDRQSLAKGGLAEAKSIPALRFPLTAATVLQNHIYKIISSFSAVQGKINQSFKEKELLRLQRQNPQVDKAIFDLYMEDPEVNSPGSPRRGL